MNVRPITIAPDTPVGPLARFHAEAIDVFEALDIDYACFGGRSLSEAAAAAGADVTEALAMLSAWRDGEPAPEPPLPDLVQRIITEHHQIDRDIMRDLIRRLSTLATGDAEVARIGRLLTSLAAALEPHARREERELFPMVEQLALQPQRARSGSISRRLYAEFVEHALIHDRLQKIRELTLRLRARQFADDALLDQIESFDRLAHRHIHLENNVLIPRVVELENRVRAERGVVTVT